MNRSEYNRGTMLGLTLAEIMILILFLLLMLLSVLLYKEKERAAALADATKNCRVVLNNIDDNVSLRKDVEETIKDIPQILTRIQESNLLPEQKGIKVGKVLKEYTLVRDSFDNPIGYADNLGKAATFSNDFLGNVDKTGNVINAEGNIVGRISKEGRIIGNKKRIPVGYEDINGRAISHNGDVLGTTDKIGNVIRSQSPAENEKTDSGLGYIGFVDSNIAYDFKGNEIGTVKKDQNIFDHSGNLIGYLSNKATLIRNSEGVGIGYMNALGRIKGEDNQTIAISDAAGNIFKATSQVLGYLPNKKALVYNENGDIIGYLDRNNIVLDTHNEKIGYVENSGTAIALDGSWLGRIGQRNKLIKDKNNFLIGFQNYDGKKYSLKNKEIQENNNTYNNNKNRLVRDSENKIIGYFDDNLNIISGNDEYELDGNNIKNKTGEIIGKLKEYIYFARDNNGNIIGYENELGHILDFNEKIIGITDNAGDILSSNGKKISSVALSYARRKNGKIYLVEPSVQDKTSNLVRAVSESPLLFEKRQPVINKKGEIIGYEDDNGNIKDFQNNRLGDLDADGKVFDDEHKNIGEIKDFKHLIIQQNDSQNFASVMNSALDCLESNKYKEKGGLYACTTENKRLNRELLNLQGQNKNLQKTLRDSHNGNGGWGTPPCWATPDGKAEFIYNVYLEDNGLIIRDNYLVNRENEMKLLPVEDIPLDTILSAEEFLKATKPLYQWGQKHSCNFFVNMYDNMNTAPKEMYKALRKSVEGHFYIREAK